MIIVRLKGGLGNQLFQYAFGRALSERTGQALFFDTNAFKSRKQVRQYELSKFAVEANCSIPFFVRMIINIRYIANKFLKKINKIGSVRFYDEHHIFHYDEQVLQKCGTGINYYDGYWQCPLYFNSIRFSLLKELKIKLPLSSLSLALGESIRKENAVSVHIRRGDYVSNSFHEVCSLEYYERAIQLFIKEEGDISLYIFSDDIPWARANLIIDNRPVYYVEHSFDSTNHEDLYLMSLCKHNIMANSSFSWWGAWFNEYPLKRVVAPQDWGFGGVDKGDLIPKEWGQIKRVMV